MKHLARDFEPGTIVRCRINSAGGHPHDYVAEVRTDFGKPAWAGTWHGFTMEPDRLLEVTEILWRPGCGPIRQVRAEPFQESHPDTMIGGRGGRRDRD